MITYYNQSFNIVFNHLLRLRESKSVNMIVFPFFMIDWSYEFATSHFHDFGTLIELATWYVEQKSKALSAEFLSFVDPAAGKLQITREVCRLPSNNRSHFLLNKIVQLLYAFHP